ncbi:MAG: KEOPS complex subunit Pcc1 [Aigarchaeota archaeon]|nr:KEOPS complex subunit Pcc1 [Candidatus Pelearchaeum maunauluense]
MQQARMSNARVEMEFEDEHVAEVVFKALFPDNKPLPAGLEVNAELEGKRVIFKVYCRRSLQSLLATIDDILSMAKIAEQTAKTMNS